MQCTTNFSGREMIHNKNERIKTGCRLMLTHFSSFSFQITAYFSLIFEPIMDQVCLLYPFLRSIHFQFLMLLEISMLQGTFSPGYLGEPRYLFENIQHFQIFCFCHIRTVKNRICPKMKICFNLLKIFSPHTLIHGKYIFSF